MNSAVLEKAVGKPTGGGEEAGNQESEALRTLRRRVKIFQRFRAFKPETPDGLVVKRATTVEELEAGYRLVHECFVDSGYIEPHPTGLRVRAFSALPDTALYLALADGRVVGTLSMIADGPLGLPMDGPFGLEIARLRRMGRRLVEVSDLAIAKDYRNLRVLTELTRCAMAHAVTIGADDAVVAVSPSHSGFFEGILQFEPLGDARPYSAEKNDIVEGKRLSLVCIQEKYRGLDRVLGQEAFLYDFYFARNPYFSRMPFWFSKGREAARDPDWFVDFFVKRAALLSRCSERELRVLASHYPAVALWRGLATRAVEPAWQRGQRLTQVLRRAVAVPATG